MPPLMRIAEDKDKTEILALLNSVFSENQRSVSLRDDAYWKWKFTDSPFGASTLIVAEQEGQIIGVNNWWPWEFVVRGQVIKALQPCDSVVHRDFRGKGCFKQLRMYGLKFAQDNGVQLLFNYPNQNSLPVYLSLGWHFQKLLPWRVKILRPFSIAKGFFYSSKSESVVVDSRYTIDVKMLDSLAKMTSSYDHYLKINRVEGFHEWRYMHHPFRSYGMIKCEMGRKSSAAIFTINIKSDNIEMVVVDIIGATDNILPLMSRVVSEAKNMGVAFIAVMDNLAFNTSELWKQGFIKRNFKNMVVLPIDLKLESFVKGYSNWSLMAVMHDSI